jgi:hypothetical protein
MGMACGTHGAEEKCTQRFGRETERKQIVWKTKKSADGRIILKCMTKKQDGKGWVRLIG